MRRVAAAMALVVAFSIVPVDGMTKEKKPPSPAAGIAIEKKPPSPTPPRERNTERYILYISPHLREDTYLLDSQTGRVWKQVKTIGDTENIGSTAWEEMPRIDLRENQRIFFSIPPKVSVPREGLQSDTQGGFRDGR